MATDQAEAEAAVEADSETEFTDKSLRQWYEPAWLLVRSSMRRRGPKRSQQGNVFWFWSPNSHTCKFGFANWLTRTKPVQFLQNTLAIDMSEFAAPHALVYCITESTQAISLTMLRLISTTRKPHTIVVAYCPPPIGASSRYKVYRIEDLLAGTCV